MDFELRNKLFLKGISDHAADAIRAKLTMPNPKYIEAQKRGRWTGGIEPELRFFRDADQGFVVPRGFAYQAYRLCQQHGERIRVIDHRHTLPEINFQFRGELRNYQQRAYGAILSRDSGVAQLPTGAGKTVLALATIAERRQPALILCHNRELADQWRDKIRQFMGIDAGLVGGGKYQVEPVTVGLFQSVRKHLPELSQAFGHVVVDEAHRCPAANFKECVSAFPARYLLGLTATCYRNDGLTKLIYFLMGDRVFEIDRAELEQVGAILRPEVSTIRTGFKFNYRDDYGAMVTALVEDKERNRLIARTIEDNLKGGTGLVVSDRKQHLHDLASMVGTDGAEILTGDLSAKERTRVVEALAQGKVRILFSTLSLISEGFDAAGLSHLFLASPIKFKGRIIQTVGRVLRPGPDGKRPRIYDFADTEQPLLAAQAKKRGWVLAELSGQKRSGKGDYNARKCDQNTPKMHHFTSHA